jgi:nickel-type superoxide dismutase maturation protease
VTSPITPRPEDTEVNQRASKWAPVVAVGPLELILWALRQRIRVRVDGSSMHPTLHNGVHVLVQPTKHAIVGDIVLCLHPFKRDVHIIKRVEATSDGGMQLTGDNAAASTDSNSFGEVPWDRMRGVVTAQMA